MRCRVRRDGLARPCSISLRYPLDPSSLSNANRSAVSPLASQLSNALAARADPARCLTAWAVGSGIARRGMRRTVGEAPLASSFVSDELHANSDVTPTFEGFRYCNPRVRLRRTLFHPWRGVSEPARQVALGRAGKTTIMKYQLGFVAIPISAVAACGSSSDGDSGGSGGTTSDAGASGRGGKGGATPVTAQF